MISSSSKRMGHSRNSERHIPRCSLHRVHGAEGQQEQRWELRRIEPLVVRRKVSQNSDAQACHLVVRASECEAFRPQLAGREDISTDPERRDSQYVLEVPSTPPSSTKLEELMVPDSPEICKKPPNRSGNFRRTARKDNLDLAQRRVTANVESMDGSQSARVRSVEDDKKRFPGECFSRQTWDHVKRIRPTNGRIPPLAKEATFNLWEPAFDGTFDRDLNEATGTRSHLTESGLADVASAGEKVLDGSLTVGKPAQLLSLDQEVEGRSMSVRWQHLTKRVQVPDFLNVEGRVPLTTFSTASGKPIYGSFEGFRKAKALLGEALEEPQSCGEIQVVEYKRNKLEHNHPSQIPDKQSKAEGTTLHYAPVTSAAEIEYHRNLPMDMRTAMLKEVVDRLPRPSFVTEAEQPLVVSSVSSAELAKARSMTGYGDLHESRPWAERRAAGSRKQWDAQYPLHTEASRPVRVTSFVSGIGQPITVLDSGLGKARSLVGDNDMQDKENWSIEEDAGFQEHLSSDIQCPRSSGADSAFLRTCFVTGNMKPVSVSSGSLMKARELFGDDLCETERWDDLAGAGFRRKRSREVESFSGGRKTGLERNLPQDIQPPRCNQAEGTLPLEHFVTGNRGSLSVSSESLTKARASPGDAYTKEEQVFELAGSGSHRNQTLAVPMTCFVTGNMKPVSVSSESLMKAKKLFEDELQETERCDEPAGAGVQRMRNREVESLSGGRKTGFQRNLHRDVQSPKMKEAEGALPVDCFVTGNVGPLNLSSESLMKARTLLGNSYEKEEKLPDLAGAGSHRNQALAVPMTFFVTGNMKPVSVSSGSLMKAKELFGDEIQETERWDDLAGAGFQQRRNRVVESLSTRQKTDFQKNLFQDIHSPRCKEADGALPLKRFVIGNMGSLPVSFESLAKAKALLGDACEKEEHQPELAGTGSHGDVGRVSLTTMRNASGNSIAVSSSAMKRARVLLGLDERVTGNCVPPSSTAFSGQIKDANMPLLHEFNSRTYGSHADKVANIFPKPANASIVGFEKTQLARGHNEKENHLGIDRNWGAKYFEHSGDKTRNLKTGYGPSDAPGASSFEVGGREPLGGESVRIRSGRLASVSDEAADKARVLLEGGERRLLSTDAGVSSPVAEFPSSAREDDLSRAVLSFKPPRKQPDASFKSAGIRVQHPPQTSAGASAISDLPHCLARPYSSTAFSGREYLPSSRSDTLQDGDATCNSDTRKLQECVTTADEAEAHRMQYIAADGGRHSAGSLEAWKQLLEMGADSRYASQAWVANHFRWIVWKLASVERRCTGPAARPPLTVNTVLHELKSRYDIEMAGRRSAIKRITERSSSAASKMILCVSAIRDLGGTEDLHQQRLDERQQKPAKIEVTDGWYRLNAILDTPLTRQLQLGRLKTGQKIQVCGARLNSRPDGSSPLEAFQDCLLLLHMNGVYRARRYEQLGFCREHYIPLAFMCIKPEGGLVPQTYVGVTRVYPLLYKETSEDFSVLRSTRAEERAVGQFESRRGQVMDEAMPKLVNFYKSSLSPEEDEDNRLFVDVENAAEPDVLMAGMTPAQLKKFGIYQENKNVLKQVAVESAVKGASQEARLDSRNVKRVLRVRVAGLIRRGNESRALSSNEGIITIWDVGDDEHYIREGCVYRVSGLRPVARPFSRNAHPHQIHLNSLDSSAWRQVPQDAYDKDFSFPYMCRAPTVLSDLDEKFVNREFDLSAMVIKVEEPFYTGAFTNQWVFVTDGTTARDCPWDETEMLAIRLSLPSPAFVRIEDSLVGSVIGYCNLLQRPKDSNCRLWVAEASEQSFLSSNLSHPTLQHLLTAAAAVSKRVNHPWMADQLRDHLQMMISQCASNWPPSSI